MTISHKSEFRASVTKVAFIFPSGETGGGRFDEVLGDVGAGVGAETEGTPSARLFTCEGKDADKIAGPFSFHPVVLGSVVLGMAGVGIEDEEMKYRIKKPY